MRLITDFHIHSPYSRAVSKEMTLENLDLWARIKGVNVLGTGDFTHPKWLKEIKSKLQTAEPGLFTLQSKYKVKNGRFSNIVSPLAPDTRFMLTVEISSIYSKNNSVRRIHNLIFFPKIDDVEKFNAHLGLRGNLASDGRPIVGVDSKELLKLALSINPDALFVPAHAWTPWFSVFGSKSGFNSLEECFDELTPYVFAIETGLSSDPAMNWRWSALDKITLISNSDSHSLTRIGREANEFDTELSYMAVYKAIRYRDPKIFKRTIEFFPEEGKYHFDGHRVCSVSYNPSETKLNSLLCLVCKRPVTVGVMHRVEQLADRIADYKLQSAVPFQNMVPLDQIIADSLDVGVGTKTVWGEYERLLKSFGTEFFVLFQAEPEHLRQIALAAVAQGIMRVREGKLHIQPGYDGEYGKIQIFTETERRDLNQQPTLL